MVKVTTEKVKLSEISLNADNPRTITEKDMARLVKSLREFPEMMQLREVVCDENMTILGGNMRFRALEQIGEKDCVAKIVIGLTDEQKRRFVISDNGFFGEWNFDILANLFSDLPLTDFGVDLPIDWLQTKESDILPDEPPTKQIFCPSCGAQYNG